MEKSLSTFDRNYDLFMERFPKLALMLSLSSEKPAIDETLASIELAGAEVFYFYGVGNGEIYLIAKGWLHQKPERRLVFLSDDFSYFLQSERAEEILSDPQVLFEFPSEIEALAEKFPRNQIEVACLPSLKGKKFHSFRLELLRKTTLSHALHVDRLHGYQPFMNFIQNVKQLPSSFYANGLKSRFSGIPAIICGAGPSLGQAIPFLKKMEDKALFIAGGSTLAALSSEGITPHFGMAIDPNLEEFRRLKNSFAFEVPFLYSTRVFPAIFQTCNGPFGYMRSGIGGLLELWMEEELGLTDPLLGKNLSDESISVTTICVAWAQFLGCNPIIFSGVDLAYTDKKRYAKGVDGGGPVEFLKHTSAANQLIKKKDREGRSILTAVRWVMEAASLSHFAREHPEITFLNTTEGGMEIKNIDYQPLGQLQLPSLAIHLREKVRQEIFASKMPERSREIIEERLAELLSSLNRVIIHLEVLSRKTSPLDELELVDEMAYSYLFYDASILFEKELDLIFPSWPGHDESSREREKWRRFLQLAEKYRLVLDRYC